MKASRSIGGCTLCFVMLLAASVVSGEEQVKWRSATDLAQRTHLKPLKDGGADELRIWVTPVILIGGDYGFIANSKGVVHCEFPLRKVGKRGQDDLVDLVAKCETAKNHDLAKRLLGYLPELRNGSFKDCVTLDGDEVVVDGVLNGKKFTFIVGNPEQCHSVFKEIYELLKGSHWHDP